MFGRAKYLFISFFNDGIICVCLANSLYVLISFLSLSIKKIKRVLWIYYEGNDLSDLKLEFKNKILINYLKDKSFSQNLIFRKQEIDKLILKTFEQSYNRARKNKSFKNLINFIKLSNTRLKISSVYTTSAEDNASIKVFGKILKLSNEFTKENNSKLYFVFLPAYERYIDKSNNNNSVRENNYKKVIQIVRKLDIPIIDINKELFLKHDDPLVLFPFRKRGHYTKEGYQLVAETIFEKINKLEK